MKIKIAALFLACFGTAVHAVECGDETYQGNSFTRCIVDHTKETVDLFLYDEKGAPYGQFSTLDRALIAQGRQLAFAMNAGMYHEDRSPVGHYVEHGTTLKKVIENAGPGNFGLLPNGIYCITENRATVVETRKFQKQRNRCKHATQSGPMLVIDGKLHPRFLKNSTSKYIRNGVGTSPDGKQSVFVISNNTVTFHAFASYFRDALKLQQALYFDGNISRLYAPSLNRSGFGFTTLGPIVAVTKDK